MSKSKSKQRDLALPDRAPTIERVRVERAKGKTRDKRQLYFAYGANTHIESMSIRCPAAAPVGAIILPGHRLVFRGVADVIPHKVDAVHGALWRITAECEASLDRFEGYPYLYIKRYITVPFNGRDVQVMLYVMRRRERPSLPSRSYESTLRTGYAQFQLPHAQLDAAITRARNAYLDDPRPVRNWKPRGVPDAYLAGDRDDHTNEREGDVPLFFDDDGFPVF